MNTQTNTTAGAENFDALISNPFFTANVDLQEFKELARKSKDAELQVLKRALKQGSICLAAQKFLKSKDGQIILNDCGLKDSSLAELLENIFSMRKAMIYHYIKAANNADKYTDFCAFVNAGNCMKEGNGIAGFLAWLRGESPKKDKPEFVGIAVQTANGKIRIKPEAQDINIPLPELERVISELIALAEGMGSKLSLAERRQAAKETTEANKAAKKAAAQPESVA